MSDYRYGDVISMQEAAIRRVNEMQRRAREAARLANEELSSGTFGGKPGEKSSSPSGKNRPAGHTSLPVDYLHNPYPPGNSPAVPMSGTGGHAGATYSLEEKAEKTASFPQPCENKGENPQPRRNQKESPPPDRQGNRERASVSASGGKSGNAWAQTAVNRQHRQTVPSPAQRESLQERRQGMGRGNQNVSGDDFSFSGSGIFSALGGVMSNMDNDTILLLGLLYILWRDGADYGLLFALFYILM